MKYYVAIQMTDHYVVEVDADNPEAAEKKAEDMELSNLEVKDSTIEFFAILAKDEVTNGRTN